MCASSYLWFYHFIGEGDYTVSRCMYSRTCYSTVRTPTTIGGKRGQLNDRLNTARESKGRKEGERTEEKDDTSQSVERRDDQDRHFCLPSIFTHVCLTACPQGYSARLHVKTDSSMKCIYDTRIPVQLQISLNFMQA